MSGESKEQLDSKLSVHDSGLEAKLSGVIPVKVLTALRDAVHQYTHVPGDAQHESTLRNLFLIEFVEKHLNKTKSPGFLDSQEALQEKVKEYILNQKQYAYAFRASSEPSSQTTPPESDNLRIAKQATIWAQAFVKDGETFLSNNEKSAEDFKKTVMRVSELHKKTSQFDHKLTTSLSALVEDALNQTLKSPIKYAAAILMYTGAAIALKEGLGNCNEMTGLVLDYIAQHYPNVRAEHASIAPGDHAFVIIGRPLASDPNDISTWSSAIVCDAWSGLIYSATEINALLHDFKWDKNLETKKAEHKLIKFNPAKQKVELPEYSNAQSIYELRNTMSLIKRDYPEIYAQSQPENWVISPDERIGDFIEKTLRDNPKHLIDLLRVEPTLAESINIKGETLLHLAVKINRADVLDVALKINPGLINLQDRAGCTALHLASEKANSKLMALLMAARPDTTLLDNNGHTAHQIISTKSNKTELMSALNEHSIEDAKKIASWQDKFKPRKSSETIKNQISTLNAEVEQLKSNSINQRFSTDKKYTSYLKLTAPQKPFAKQSLLEQLSKSYETELKKMAKTDTADDAQLKLDLNIGHKNLLNFVHNLTEIARLLQRDQVYANKHLPELTEPCSMATTDFVSSTNKLVVSGLLRKRSDQNNAINAALEEFNLTFAKLTSKSSIDVADEKMYRFRPLIHDVTAAEQHKIKLKAPPAINRIQIQTPKLEAKPQKYSISALLTNHSGITEKNKPAKPQLIPTLGQSSARTPSCH